MKNLLFIKNQYLIIFLVLFFVVGFHCLIVIEILNALPTLSGSSSNVFHINIADSFRFDKTFNLNYVETTQFFNSVDDLSDSNKSNIGSPQGSKGPTYYILLGIFYELFSTSHEDLFIHAVIFNSILVSVFLVIFFFFVRKTFNLRIAIASSFFASLISGLSEISVIPSLEPLLFIFLLSSLFFLERKKLHYILFGIFTGLADLTHPSGFTLIISYSIFILLKREFTGFLIIFGTWIIVLLPWLIRNFYTFSDIGRGLAIPFSTKITEIILMVFPITDGVKSCCNKTSALNILSTSYSVDIGIIEYLTKAMETSASANNSQILLIFILVFTGVSFFNLTQLKNRFWYMIITIGCTFGIFYYIFNIKIDPIIQLLFVLILPTIFILLILKKKRQIFSIDITKFQSFSILYFLIHLLAVYYFALSSNWIDISTRFFLFQLLLLIPLGLFGFEKSIKEKFKKIQGNKKNIILIIILIGVPSTFSTIEGKEMIIDHYRDLNVFMTPEKIELNNWIKDNVSSEKIIASDMPAEIWYSTGIKSISVPTEEMSIQDFENYIKVYNISYLVYYNNLDSYFEKSIDQLHAHNYNILNYTYNKIKINDSTVVEVKDILKSDISNLPAHIAKMVELERLERFNDLKIARDELKNVTRDELKNVTSDKIEIACEILINNKLYEDSISICSKILQNDPNNITAFHNFIIDYSRLNENEKKYEMIQLYDKIIENSSSKQDIVSWGKIMNYLIQNNLSDQQLITERFDKAKMLYEQGKFEQSLILLEQLIHVQEIHDDVYILMVKTWPREIYDNNNYVSFIPVLIEYDKAIKIQYDYLELLTNTDQDDRMNVEKLLFTHLNDKATHLTKLNESDKAYYVYLEILKINDTDPEIFKKIAEHKETFEPQIAIYYYEEALKLDIDNKYYIKKIEELRKIIENSPPKIDIILFN